MRRLLSRARSRRIARLRDAPNTGRHCQFRIRVLSISAVLDHPGARTGCRFCYGRLWSTQCGMFGV